MKTLLVATLIFICSASFAQDKAKIIFIRDTGYFGWAADFKEFIDDEIVCMLDNKSYNTVEVLPGTHSITWQSAGKEINKFGKDLAVTMDLKAGTTYYMQMVIVKKFMKYEFAFNEVTESTGLKLIADLKEDTNCFK